MPDELTTRHAQILLVLAEGSMHGYAIARQIETYTSGAVVLKPGSMYRALHQLLEARLIEEIHVPDSKDDRRREYRITALGRKRLRSTLEYFQGLVKAGRRAGVMGGVGS